MGPIERYYVWCLNGLKVYLTSSSHFCAKSPTFIIGECEFFLQFAFNKSLNEISAFLCRGNDTDSTVVKVNFSLSLKSFIGLRVHEFQNTFSFSKGQNNGFTIQITEQDLFACLYNEYKEDLLIITCETINLKPKFVHYREDIRALSEDLMKLFVEEDCANADLVTEGGAIFRVHKEILSARSPVFRQKFIETYDTLTLDKSFSPEVVKTMLTFLYSADISKMDLDSLSVKNFLKELLDCAMHYNIVDLISLLKPRMTYFTTMVPHCQENRTLQFKNFTTLCKSVPFLELRPIKMNFDKRIELRSKLLFKPYVKRGMIILEGTIWNLFQINRIFVRLFLLDNFNKRRYSQQIDLEPTIEGTAKFCFKYQAEQLFSERDLILPDDILTLQYELTILFPGKFSFSDPDVRGDDDYQILCFEVSRSLVKSMDYLLQSKCFSDFKLLLPYERDTTESEQVSVHKSILSARSSVFNDLLKRENTIREISIDLPAKVVNNLLYYTYTGILRNSKLRSLSLLLGAAGTYEMNQLKRSCKGIVANMALDFNNVYIIYLIAVRSGDYELQKSCKDFILKNKDIVLGSRRWDTFRKKYANASGEIMNYIGTKS